VHFAVEDRGRGVAPGDEERIFEPFHRGVHIADGIRGTGLGLSIARRLAEAQRGSLVYEPRDGGGSRFTLELPAGTAPLE
jgi:two-component system sensor histidine kinase KdpD